MIAFLSMVAGLGILTLGAEWLIRAACRLALSARVSPLVIGLTVVAFGTSAPELVVSLQSVLAGEPEIAVGNVVGSNIFNILFILGISAVITPLIVAQQLIRYEVPVLIAMSCLAGLMARDGVIGRWDGILFVLFLVVYTVWAIRKGRREQQHVQQEYAEQISTTAAGTRWDLAIQLVLLAAGLVGLVVGARLFLFGAVTIARALGVSELVIGLTLVAAGTSLPEVATSVLAAIRGQRDIAVGNAIGSNLFNLMCVLGLSSAISPAGIPVAQSARDLDIPVMIAVAFACLPIFWTGHRIDRWEGFMFLGYFAAYYSYLLLSALDSDFQRTLVTVMVWFVIPLTVITVVITLIRSLPHPHRRGSG